jgi:hypothetical protein
VNFLRGNFDSGDFGEIVYVSANPNIRFVDAHFHARIRLWEDEWDGELGVVPPSAVTKRAIQAAEQFPNKRLIIHYMQPHFPFIGEYGRSLYEEGIIQHVSDGNEFWKQLKDVGKEPFREAYEENLRITLPHIKRLIDSISGKSVVTSDHGNEFGRMGVYGHPSNTYTRNLIKVPWLVIGTNKRKHVEGGSATAGPTGDTPEIRERLEKLGYVQYTGRQRP